MKGKWRLPGRGRRLACGLLPTGVTGWVKIRVYRHHMRRKCTVCGQQFQPQPEIGRVESFRFIESVTLTLPAANDDVSFNVKKAGDGPRMEIHTQ